MKQIIGVEYFNLQEDFEAAIEKMKAILKDGDECEIVYVSETYQWEYNVLAKGKFVPNSTLTKFVNTIIFNKNLIKELGIDMNSIIKRNNNEIKLLPK